jgi:flagellar hook-length control protein FliK
MLLQAASKARTQAASANAPAVAAGPGDKASSFAKVYAKESQSKPATPGEGSAKAVRDKKDAISDNTAAPEPAVADSGKSLPADKAPDAHDKVASDDSPVTDTPMADSVPVDPTLDPALMQPETSPVVAAVQSQIEAPLAATAASVAATTAVTGPDFDPEADPLDALPAVRLALEQSGHVSASSQAQTKAAPAEAPLPPAQNFASGMATMVDLEADKDSTGQGSDSAFSGLIDDGLKDLKNASSDTRVDDFANRLAALTQAATPKTANALPVNQPLAMHQSGWTEEVVNRVMYLSSANLKSADIQLQPAELGRLDIRVNMAVDQQTQVTFMSGHPAVREALEGQMFRLRDMFTQQGMGQIDVNVSDQSRGWQGQEQAQQGQSRSGGRHSADDDLPMSVAEVAASTTSVIGSSAVDYYA